MSGLKTELKTFEKKLPEILDDQGKFALIQGEEYFGSYTSYEDAIKVGYDKFGITTEFLVKKILEQEEVHYINRHFCAPCPV